MPRDADMPDADGIVPSADDVVHTPRPRGRPRGSRNGETSQAAAAAASDTASSTDPGTAEKPRRRKKSAPKQEDIEKGAQRVMGIHAVLATIMQAPELMISPDEAMALSRTAAELATEFDLEVGGRWAVVGAAIATASAIYVPRLVHLKMRMARDAAQRAAATTIEPEPEQAHDGHPSYAPG